MIPQSHTDPGSPIDRPIIVTASGEGCHSDRPTTLDYGLFRYASKPEVSSSIVLESRQDPVLVDAGVDLVMSAREGYLIHDVDGRRLIHLHLNGGTYNLGHRNPE